jgi:hypothetical protein
MGMQFKKNLCITLLMCLVGCNQRPTNPAVDVLSNPPEEINRSTHTETSVLLNGQPALGETLSLTSGEKVHIDMKVVRHDMKVVPMTAMLEIRVMPEGSVGKQWASFQFIDHFICVPDVLNGTASLDTTVQAAPGTYDYRCFMMYYFATEEKPQFYLISKGKVIVADGSVSK